MNYFSKLLFYEYLLNKIFKLFRKIFSVCKFSQKSFDRNLRKKIAEENDVKPEISLLQISFNKEMKLEYYRTLIEIDFDREF